MKIIESPHTTDAIYSYDAAKEIYENRITDTELRHNVFACSGKTWKTTGRAETENLDDITLYIARLNRNGDRLVFYHVTATRKTRADWELTEKRFHSQDYWDWGD